MHIVLDAISNVADTIEFIEAMGSQERRRAPEIDDDLANAPSHDARPEPSQTQISIENRMKILQELREESAEADAYMEKSRQMLKERQRYLRQFEAFEKEQSLQKDENLIDGARTLGVIRKEKKEAQDQLEECHQRSREALLSLQQLKAEEQAQSMRESLGRGKPPGNEPDPHNSGQGSVAGQE